MSDARPVSPSLLGKCSRDAAGRRGAGVWEHGAVHAPHRVTHSRDSVPASTGTGLGRRLPWRESMLQTVQQTGPADTNPLKRKPFLAALSASVSSSN